MKFAAALAAASLLSATPAQAANPPLQIKLKSCPAATLTGFVGDYMGGAPGSMRQFLGIPYADAPVGSKRWQPPEPFCWSGDRDAKMFGNWCPQGPTLDAWENEDCLMLNVFTRPTGTVSKQPVMVYIHGGGLSGGSGNYQLNPVNLVSRGVIVVTLNYRLGALGFLAHPALDKTATKNTGNYGILDQQAALKWVKANIARFGGDPANITIFGGSAGGLSVAVHLVSPLSTGLFHKAILESAALGVFPTLSAAEEQGRTFASHSGCSSQTAACLRALPVATILAHQTDIGNSVGLLRQDNVVLKSQIKDLMSAGKFAKVPTIVGSTHDEARFHLNGNMSIGSGDNCHFQSNLTPANYNMAVQNNFGGQTVAVLDRYAPGVTTLSAHIALAAALTDRNFACRAFRSATAMAAKNAGKVYGYEFSDPKAPPTLWPEFKMADGSKFPYGAYHGAEGSYLFPASSVNGCGTAIPAMTKAQKALGKDIVTYWTTFAKTGKPSATAASKPKAWPLFSTGKMIRLGPGAPVQMTASSFDTFHKCTSFWNSATP